MPWLRPPTSTYLNLKKVEIEGKLFVEEVHPGSDRTSRLVARIQTSQIEF